MKRTRILDVERIKPTSNQAEDKPFYVRTNLRAELLKSGVNANRQRDIFSILDDSVREEAKMYNIEIVGIENTQMQDRALFAIQKLLTDTNYKGNSPGQKLQKGNAFKIEGLVLPVLRVTAAQYLKAFGAKKYRTSRGKNEFSGREKKRAFQAMADLGNKKYLFYYERKYWKKNDKGKYEECYDLISTVQPLIIIKQGYEALTRQERDKVKSAKSAKENDIMPKYFEIVPCPILIDQIDTYFVLKPANCYQEIRLLFPYASKYVYRFIDYLFTQARFKSCKNAGWTIKINYLELARKLRMDGYIRTRQQKRIKETLKRCYRIAKKRNYLLVYKTVTGVTKEIEHLELNPEKFAEMKSIDKKRNEEDY